MERWGAVSNHPHLVGLREAFISTEMDSTPALFFSHDYHPGAWAWGGRAGRQAGCRARGSCSRLLYRRRLILHEQALYWLLRKPAAWAALLGLWSSRRSGALQARTQATQDTHPV